MDSLKGISKPLEYYGAGLEKKQRYRGQKDEDQDKYDLLFDYPSSRDQSGGKRRERSDVPLRRDGSLEIQEEKYEKNHSHDRYEWQARNDRRSKDERRERSDRNDRNDNRKKYERNPSRDRYERLDRYDKQDKERS